VWLELEKLHLDEEPEENLLVITTVRENVPKSLENEIRNWGSISSQETSLASSEDGLGEFSKEYREFVYSICAKLDSITTDVIHRIMWRNGLLGGASQLEESEPGSLLWDEDERFEDEHRFLPNRVPQGVRYLSLPEMWIGEFEHNGVTTLRAPVSFELLSEAFRIADTCPRSSLVISVAALETGLKLYIVKVRPQTEWMVENLQSPPVVKILREYFDTLPCVNNQLESAKRPPKKYISDIRKAIELRNKISHGKAKSVKASFLKEVLMQCRDLLYYLDWLAGEVWALEKTSNTFREEMQLNIE
jgi:hypothetical protein